MYRVIHDESAVDQIAALPAELLPAYAEALAVLELTPTTAGRPYNDAKPDGPMRELVFGNGAGTITYLNLDRYREVHVLIVQWL